MTRMAGYHLRKIEVDYLKRRTSGGREVEAEPCYRNWRGWEERSFGVEAAWREQVRHSLDPSC